MLKLKFALIALLVSASLPAIASPLTGATDGTTANNPLYAGQSFIIGGSLNTESLGIVSFASLSSAPFVNLAPGSFDHITFNFFSASASTPYAVGTGYLFTQAFRGAPSELSSSSAGLVGTASSNGSVYTFAPTLTLSAGIEYYFYENAAVQPLSGNSSYTGGGSFAASSFCTSFSGPLPPLNFQLNGVPASPTVTPEPSTFALLCTGILAMAGAVRKRFV